MTVHSSILAWKIPGTEEPGGGGYSPWGHKESDTIKHSIGCYPILESGSGRCSINNFCINTFTFEVVT